jgi:hypothetical protein
MAETFKPGDTVPNSGIYRVVHDEEHAEEHEVTCVSGKPFPPCRDCGSDVRFKLVRKAKHISKQRYFRG